MINVHTAKSRIRLDALLVELGHYKSRARARDAVPDATALGQYSGRPGPKPARGRPPSSLDGSGAPEAAEPRLTLAGQRRVVREPRP